LTARAIRTIINKLVNNQQTTAVFAALSDPTRRGILGRLSSSSENSVATLLGPFRMSAPAISRHLRILEQAKLIERRREGRRHFIRARSEGLRPAQDWMNQCKAGWEFSFNTLDGLLAKERKGKKL
jgi:DNA-binding transcriptional ArsR family regulator